MTDKILKDLILEEHETIAQFAAHYNLSKHLVYNAVEGAITKPTERALCEIFGLTKSELDEMNQTFLRLQMEGEKEIARKKQEHKKPTKTVSSDPNARRNTEVNNRLIVRSSSPKGGWSSSFGLSKAGVW